MPSRATLAAAAAAAAAAFAGLVLHRRRRRSPVADDDLPERIVSQHWRDEGAQPRMLSGASPGADTLFGAAAARAGHVVVHFLGPNNEPSETAAREQADSLCRVQRATIEHPSVTAALRDAAAARLKPLPDAWAEEWYDSRRNFLQVRRADAVFAVGYRQPSDDPPLDIGGGTGFAVQFYVDRFRAARDARSGLGGEPADRCKLYFFDDSSPGWSGCKVVPRTHKKWSAWDVRAQAWVPLSGKPPPPAGTWAGIGGTRLSADGERAITELMAS